MASQDASLPHAVVQLSSGSCQSIEGAAQEGKSIHEECYLHLRLHKATIMPAPARDAAVPTRALQYADNLRRPALLHIT